MPTGQPLWGFENIPPINTDCEIGLFLSSYKEVLEPVGTCTRSQILLQQNNTDWSSNSQPLYSPHRDRDLAKYRLVYPAVEQDNSYVYNLKRRIKAN